MNKHRYFFTFWLLSLVLALPSYAQYATTPPTRDGNISDAEYNSTTTNGVSTNKFKTGSGGTWYMTWDANYLYVAKTDGKVEEPNVMYLDLNPQVPVTGGSLAQGNLTGTTDYNVKPNLPFRGDVRVFFTDKTIEIRRATSDAQGNETWSAPVTAGLDISNTGTNRELRLSWNTLTNGNGIPPSFNWFGYATNLASDISNTRYDLAPDNPGVAGVNGGATPSVEYYYTIISTANGSATKPFTLKSYTFPRNTNSDNFGSIEVWDFTMDSPRQYISRGGTGGTWNISGSLVVGAGIVYFGSSTSNFGQTFVGNVRTLGTGILNMDQTNQPLNVREDVTLNGGSQLQLAGAQGGDLVVGRDFIVTNGTGAPATFQPMGRNVTFTGFSVAHRIQSDNNYVIPFSFLTLNTPSGTVTLDTDIRVISAATFTNGLLNTGSNFVELVSAANLGTETTASHIVGNVRITQSLNSTLTTDFGNLGLRILPQNGQSVQGSVTLARVTGTTIPGVGSGGASSIQRYFRLTANGTSFTNPNFLVEFAYRLDELNGIPENNLALYRSLVSATGPYALLTPTTTNTGAHTVTYNYQTALANDTYLTLSTVAPLPVTLTSFTAQATSQGTALLRWTTASEVNSKGFGIERQLATGGAWQSVGYVAATNHATGSSYTFTDKSLTSAPASAQVYYRLRQEDLDGTLSYSPVAVIARPSAIGSTELVLSPVPVGSGKLSLAFAEAGQAGSVITVSSAQGQRVLHLTTEASAAEALSLPIDGLAPGVYIVRVQVVGQDPRFARFVKQ